MDRRELNTTSRTVLVRVLLSRSAPVSRNTHREYVELRIIDGVLVAELLPLAEEEDDKEDDKDEEKKRR